MKKFLTFLSIILFSSLALADGVSSTTARRIIRFTGAPSNPVEGDVYENLTTHLLFYYDGTTFQQLSSGITQSAADLRYFKLDGSNTGTGNLNLGNTGLFRLGSNSYGYTNGTGPKFCDVSSGSCFTLDLSGLSIDRTDIIPDASGTLVLTSRSISTTSPLSGGGDFSANRTFSCPTCATSSNNLSFFSATSSAQLLGLINDETGGGLAVFNNAPALLSPTTDTLQSSGNVGIGVTPNATSGRRLDILQTGNQSTILDVRNSDAASTGALALLRAGADVSALQVVAYGTAFSATVAGVNIGGWSSLNNGAGGSGILIGTTNSAPLRIFTNSTLSMLVDTSQGVTFSGAIIPSQTVGITGTTTNNNANAGAFGEYQTGTVSANTTSLSTGTTANVGTNTNITLTAGDWDCSGVVNFTFGATTSITNLAGGISTTTATLPAQDSYFDYETSAIIPTGSAVATWIVPVVRISVAGSTSVFLVSQATFTASTLKVGGTIRCRRMR